MQLISTKNDNLGFQQTTLQGIEWNAPTKEKNIRNWKDEIVTKFTEGINKSRVGTKWKPLTEQAVAVKINQHPIYKNSRDECYALLKVCEQKHFGIFFTATKIK